MFNDERINRICGGIYRTGILLAVLYTVLFGVCRALIVGFRISLYLTEICIILTGGIILTVGLIRWGFARDERADYERHRYYLTAGKVFVVMALLGYAISIPLRIRQADDYPVNELILHLLILGCVYFFYTFKRHQVSFNYTFIDESAAAYYIRVLLNTAKLAGILLLPFGLAALLDLMLYGSFIHFLAILWGYVASVLGLGTDYFLLSALEKCNVEPDTSERMSDWDSSEESENKPTVAAPARKGTILALFLLVAVQAVSLILRVVYWILLEHPLTTIGQTVAAFSLAMQRCSDVYLVLAALAFGFLMEYHLISKRIRAGICGILAVRAVDLILRVVKTAMIYTLERLWNDPMVIRIYTECLTYLSFVLWLLIVIFTCVLIRGLTRDLGVSRALWLTVGVEVVCLAVGLFWISQNQSVMQALTVGAGGLVAAILWPLILSGRVKRHTVA